MHICPVTWSVINPSELFWCRDVCLLSTVMELDGASLKLWKNRFSQLYRDVMTPWPNQNVCGGGTTFFCIPAEMDTCVVSQISGSVELLRRLCWETGSWFLDRGVIYVWAPSTSRSSHQNSRGWIKRVRGKYVNCPFNGENQICKFVTAPSRW